MKYRTLGLWTLLSMLLVSIQMHFSNTESYLNYFDTHSLAKDYDDDGDAEKQHSYHLDLVKISQVFVLFTSFYVHFFPSPILTKKQFPLSDELITGPYLLTLFRPPIEN